MISVFINTTSIATKTIMLTVDEGLQNDYQAQAICGNFSIKKKFILPSACTRVCREDEVYFAVYSN